MSEHVNSDKKINTIRTAIPYCFYRIDQRFFKLDDTNQTEIQFSKVETVPNRRTGNAHNIEFIRDRWGVDAHSKIIIKTYKSFDDIEDAKSFTLKLINNFIKIYRKFDPEAVHLISLINEDLDIFDLSSNGKGMVSLTFGGGISSVSPDLIQNISNKVEDFICSKQNIPLWEDLILNAEQYIYQNDFRHSLLESVIALELEASSFIRKIGISKNIDESLLNNFIKDVGITGNLRVTLKLLLDTESLPSEEVFSKCKAGISLRNKVVHEGKKDITSIEAIDTLTNIKLMISFLHNN